MNSSTCKAGKKLWNFFRLERSRKVQKLSSI